MPADELLAICDEDLNRIGVAPRSEVHSRGLLHQVVHCWLIGRGQEDDWLYFQRRSHKASFAGLYDVAAAGHIDVGESAEKAVLRETQEELGVAMDLEQLEHIGSFRESFELGSYRDNEICQVYVYPVDEGEFELGDEVEEMIRISLAELARYLEQGSADIHGYSVGDSRPVAICTGQLIPHQKEYYAFALAGILRRRAGR